MSEKEVLTREQMEAYKNEIIGNPQPKIKYSSSGLLRQ